jgi:site-specific DNA-methyltransferase (adenine-specific)
MEQHLFNGDSAKELKQIKDNSVDLLACDPPYAIGFMGKAWDKVLPPKDIWDECYRVLKPGSFIAVMSSPRSDVLYRMIKDLEDAGFDMSFSPILWTYHTGFPKASDTSKMIDKRAGAQREVVGKTKAGKTALGQNNGWNKHENKTDIDITTASTDLAKKYEGSKLGFQPKPTIEHIIIGMKPHGSKSYIDNVLNFEALPDSVKMTYPFVQVPKPSKKEKDFGLGDDIPLKQRAWLSPESRTTSEDYTKTSPGMERFLTQPKKNNHPTTKPVKLMSYIITLFTREGDWVLDPFLGSGTTGIASKLLNRNFIGIEREQEYMDIIKERLSVSREDLINFFKEKK